MARIGGLHDHQLHHHHHHQPPQQQQQQQQMFTVAVSPPPLQSLTAAASGQQQQQLQQQQPAQDLASTVDLTTAADGRAPIDYLTPPPSADFQAHNFQAPAGAVDSMVRAESHHFQQNAALVQQTSPALGPFAAPAPVVVQTSPFTPVVGFPATSLQAQPPPPPQPAPLAAQAVQTSSPSNQVHSLTFASPPLEQFTPYTPTLVQSDHLHHHPQQPHQQNVGGGGRWELGFDANDILTPPFAISTPEQPPGTGHLFYQQDFGQETAASSSVRNNKQFVSGGGGGAFFGGFDTAIPSNNNNNNNNKFTPLDAVVRTSPSNKNVYWGTPKSAQQLPLRPPALYAETNAYRFNNNNNNNNHHHLHQYVDTFQMPFTGQFDGPLSQGTVADHVVHSSFRVKRQLEDGWPSASRKSDEASEDAEAGDRKPVYSYVKTDRNGNFKWSVRQGYY